MAPDVLVAFGRPKGDRGSYLQWEEGGIAPQVVFEIGSPGNIIAVMMRKFRFYERHGVEEYYLYDPDTGELSGWQRQGDTLEEIEPMEGWISPRLGIRFELERGALQLYRPDGERFATYVELMEQREQERQRAERLAAQSGALGIEPEEAQGGQRSSYTRAYCRNCLRHMLEPPLWLWMVTRISALVASTVTTLTDSRTSYLSQAASSSSPDGNWERRNSPKARQASVAVKMPTSLPCLTTSTEPI
jgi:Putative restriction endonuclease